METVGKKRRGHRLVYIVMGNDMLDTVWSSRKKVEAYVAEKVSREKSDEHYTRFHTMRIHWRYYDRRVSS